MSARHTHELQDTEAEEEPSRNWRGDTFSHWNIQIERWKSKKKTNFSRKITLCIMNERRRLAVVDKLVRRHFFVLRFLVAFSRYDVSLFLIFFRFKYFVFCFYLFCSQHEPPPLSPDGPPPNPELEPNELPPWPIPNDPLLKPEPMPPWLPIPLEPPDDGREYEYPASGRAAANAKHDKTIKARIIDSISLSTKLKRNSQEQTGGQKKSATNKKCMHTKMFSIVYCWMFGCWLINWSDEILFICLIRLVHEINCGKMTTKKKSNNNSSNEIKIDEKHEPNRESEKERKKKRHSPKNEEEEENQLFALAMCDSKKWGRIRFWCHNIKSIRRTTATLMMAATAAALTPTTTSLMPKEIFFFFS